MRKLLELLGWVALIEIWTVGTLIVRQESEATPWLLYVWAAMMVGNLALGYCVGARIREWRNQW